MSMDRMQQLFDRAENAARRRNQRPAILGKITGSGGTRVLATERGPGFVHVRLGADGNLGTAYAYNLSVPPQKGYPVLLQSIDNLLVVVGPDYSRLSSFLATQTGAGYVVAPHHHREGSGLEYEHQAKMIDRGRVKYSSGLTVAINAFRYRKSDGTWETYEGGTLDLTGNQPGTAGQHAWVVVGVDPSDNTAKAAAGTAVSTSTDLDTADIDGILDSSYIPLAAIDVHQDDTTLNLPARYHDARPWLSIGSSTDSSIQAVASEALSAGNVVNLWDDGGTLKARQADAANGYAAHGFVRSAVSMGNTATVRPAGSNDQLSGLTLGARLYLSTTAGTVTEAAPSGSGELVQEVGVATSVTEMQFIPQLSIVLD